MPQHLQNKPYRGKKIQVSKEGNGEAIVILATPDKTSHLSQGANRNVICIIHDAYLCTYIIEEYTLYITYLKTDRDPVLHFITMRIFFPPLKIRAIGNLLPYNSTFK